jgi:hypothetical protein
MSPSDDKVVDEDWPKQFEWPVGHPWRSMLPSGMHCNRCHGLVPVEEAHVGSDLTRGFRAVFDSTLLVVLLQAHVELACRAARPLVVCDCAEFYLWYEDYGPGRGLLPPVGVCRCGHPHNEHDKLTGRCVGLLEVT